ncbi:MAG: hypothetical protein AB7T10_03595 [bacterium]
MKYSSVICFAGGDWWYHHPHSYNHLMRLFAENVKVLYVNSLPVGGVKGAAGSKRIFNKLKSILRFFKKAEDNLFVFTPVFIPMKESRLLLELNSFLLDLQIRIISLILKLDDPLLWITNPNGYIYLRRGKKKKIVYQIVDKVSAYKHAGSLMRDFDKKLSKEADMIFAPGRVLCENKKKLYPHKTFRVKHGVDTEHFTGKSADKPADFPKNNRKTFTYWGSIDYKKVDYALLKHLGEECRDFNILLIGRIFDFKRDDFLSYDNIYFIGEKNYDELGVYACHSDGFLIPWDSRDEMNKNASPIKLREYLSTGKPVVATYIPEFEEFREYIYISKDEKEFAENMRTAAAENNFQLEKKRKEFVKQSGWRSVYEEIYALISDFNTIV